MTNDTLPGGLQWVPVDKITARSREAKPAEVALALAGAVLFGAGWLAAKFFILLWAVLSWIGTAIMVGWEDARGKGPQVNVAALIEENTRLRAELIRTGDVRQAGVVGPG